jgi:tRNA (mo5U34)-methyltransferase
MITRSKGKISAKAVNGSKTFAKRVTGSNGTGRSGRTIRRQELTQGEIARQVRALGKWFHNMDLGGVQTAPDHFLGDYPRNKWQNFAHAIPTNLRGKSVLDIGCNAGFYAIEMKRRGAKRVVAIDSDPKYLAQARFAAEISKVDIEFHQRSVYELRELKERFDLVLFMGVFYHLRHPLLALDVIHEYAARDLLVFQSMQRGCNVVEPVKKDYTFWETHMFDEAAFPRMYFIEHRYAGDPTNWWIPNRACSEALLRSAGFKIVDHPEEEVFVCRRESKTTSSVREELRSVYEPGEV